MKNGSFRMIRTVGAAALVLALLLSAAICAIPTVTVGRLCSACYPIIIRAREQVINSEFGDAYAGLIEVSGALEKQKHLLMVFYDHDDVIKLVCTSKTAADLALVQDQPQSIEEINDLIWSLKLLEEMNRAGAWDIF